MKGRAQKHCAFRSWRTTKSAGEPSQYPIASQLTQGGGGGEESERRVCPFRHRRQLRAGRHAFGQRAVEKKNRKTQSDGKGYKLHQFSTHAVGREKEKKRTEKLRIPIPAVRGPSRRRETIHTCCQASMLAAGLGRTRKKREKKGQK